MPSLYVHIPFCVKKCDYCAFYSEDLKTNKTLTTDFLVALGTEINMRKQDAPMGVSSLFIGGGTPTALESSELFYLMNLLNRNFEFVKTAEKTIEANPGTLNKEKLNTLVRNGINRISLGAQSFNDRLLKQVGRIHSSKDIREGIKIIREVGLRNLNLDLMFGLPGQVLKDWQETVEEALIYMPEHLSIYGLMLEEGTKLFEEYNFEGNSDNNGLKTENNHLPDDDEQAEMYLWMVERLEKAGYIHYETSNFSLPGYECKHNLGYWQGEDYIGLGPAGVSCLADKRFTNVESISNYIKLLKLEKYPVDEKQSESLTVKEKMVERVILGLRLSKGISLIAFKKEFGVELKDIYPEVLERYLSNGALYIKDDYLRLNKQFSFISNKILQDFV